jgi:septal ring factor EnvC (AmiA/AmiB activator)
VDEGDRRGVDRLTIQEAARRLGISEGAVRKRVARKSLEHDKDESDGRVYVYLDAGDRQGVDTGQDAGVDPNSTALISRLESEVAFLRDQVQRQQEIIAQQAVSMRQLTAAASQEPPEDAETVEEAPERAEPHSAAEEARDELDTERARREVAETTLHEGMAEERRRREEAERERDELRRELYARREVSEAAETGEEQQGRGEPRPAERGAQETSESLAGRGSGTARGSLWRRLFGR